MQTVEELVSQDAEMLAEMARLHKETHAAYLRAEGTAERAVPVVPSMNQYGSAHSPLVEGRIFNPDGKFDSAVLDYDKDSGFVRVRVDDSRSPTFWLEFNFNLAQLSFGTTTPITARGRLETVDIFHGMMGFSNGSVINNPGGALSTASVTMPPPAQATNAGDRTAILHAKDVMFPAFAISVYIPLESIGLQ